MGKPVSTTTTSPGSTASRNVSAARSGGGSAASSASTIGSMVSRPPTLTVVRSYAALATPSCVIRYHIAWFTVWG